jgi:CRISPR-associated protein Cas1
MRQYELSGDREFGAALAGRMVAGKISNGRSLLQRYQAKDRAGVTAGVISSLYVASGRAREKTTVGAVRGVEGAAAAQYWAAVWSLLPEEKVFPGRRRRPPTDRVNAALSLGYTLLAGEAVGAVKGAGLDGAVGFLHGVRDGRASLAFDLIEEFRPVVVDTIVVEMSRRRTLTGQGAPDGSFRLDRSCLKVFFTRYENRMTTLTTVPGVKGRVCYREALHLQAAALAWCVQHRDPSGYLPIVWRR